MHLLISLHFVCRCPFCGVSTPIKPENYSSLVFSRLEVCELPDSFRGMDDTDLKREGLVASVYTESRKWRISRFQTHLVRPWLRYIELMLQDYTHKLPGSDVKPCVWAVVEVCLGILGACLPTFPALFRCKSVRNNRKTSAVSLSRSNDSYQYPVLTPDERRIGFTSEAGNAHNEFLRMADWADVPRAVDKRDGAEV